MSVTVTICVQLAVLPAASVAVQVTVVVPSGNKAGASFDTRTEPAQLSEAVAGERTGAAVHKPEPAETVTSEGQVMLGGCASALDTLKIAFR
jgi:hypothetical protein